MNSGASSTASYISGIALDRVLPALRRLEPGARACYLYDLDTLAARARRLREAFTPVNALCAYALKANALPAIVETLRDEGFGSEAGSLGELEVAAAAGIAAGRRVLNGNGRTPEEAGWAAGHGVHSVNADHVGELDLLEREAARADARIRVALRVNPGIATPGHPYVATGVEHAKFGMSPDEALAAWPARARWPHLQVDGVHVHVGSQILDPEPLERAVEAALALAGSAADAGVPLGFVNAGGGFGIDYEGAREFPLEGYAEWLAGRAAGSGLSWVIEPGRWLVGPVGVLLAEVLWIKRRNGRRFVILAAGMNDLIRPALYGARHRIVPASPREGALEPSDVTGPVCESADVFATDIALPPLEPGDVVAVLDAGAYGAAMASNYNGRGRLAEIVVHNGRVFRARPGEQASDLAQRRSDDALEV